MRGEGPPILLIMGLGGNIEMWAPLERELNAHGYQTIAYDASGTGNSPPRLVPLRPSGLARQAAHLLDALGLPTVDVLGVSFGGGVAQELTLRNPHRVRRLVLASTMCGLGGVPGTPLALAAAGHTTALLLTEVHPRHRPLGVRTGRTTATSTLMRHQIVARRSRPPTLWGYLSQLYAVTGWTSLPWLHRITAPTLVLSGADDPLVPPVNARILGARIPNATVHVEARHRPPAPHGTRPAMCRAHRRVPSSGPVAAQGRRSDGATPHPSQLRDSRNPSRASVTESSRCTVTGRAAASPDPRPYRRGAQGDPGRRSRP